MRRRKRMGGGSKGERTDASFISEGTDLFYTQVVGQVLLEGAAAVCRGDISCARAAIAQSECESRRSGEGNGRRVFAPFDRRLKGETLDPRVRVPLVLAMLKVTSSPLVNVVGVPMQFAVMVSQVVLVVLVVA